VLTHLLFVKYLALSERGRELPDVENSKGSTLKKYMVAGKK